MSRAIEREDDVLAEIATWARGEDEVRTVVLGGSRAADPDRVDDLSDYDVVLFLSNPGRLASDPHWVERFGDVLVQLRERFDAPWQGIHTRLVQFSDGTKIDFSLSSVEVLERIVWQGTLPDWLDRGYDVLVDKDGTASELPPPSGRGRVPARPSDELFRALAEEFWWETLYVARNLVRGEILPARYSAEAVIRCELLLPALEWFVQVGRGWRQTVGSNGKGLRELLSREVWGQVEATMPGAEPSENWDALFAATVLFRSVMSSVAEDLGLRYPVDLDREVSEYLHQLRETWEEGR